MENHAFDSKIEKMKLKNVPIFEDSVSETSYALFFPAKKQFVQSARITRHYQSDEKIDIDVHTDTSRDPKFIKNESTLRNWQFIYKMHGLETEVVQIVTTVTMLPTVQTDFLDHLLIIQKELCRNNDNKCLDGGKLFEALSKKHARYLVFYMERFLNKNNSSSRDTKKEQIDFIKKTVGKKTKCWMIDLYSKISHRAIFFFSDDLTSNALLKIVAEGNVEVYDTVEKKFL